MARTLVGVQPMTGPVGKIFKNALYQLRGDEFIVWAIGEEFKGETLVELDTSDRAALISRLEEIFGPGGRNRKYKWRVDWTNSYYYYKLVIFIRDKKLLTHLRMIESR